MSKFVTYPAVTVLDDDQSLLIDSPSAGTNSITADNAADTLLSKWSGFDTFDEAVQNTIEHNQKFIDRDTAIRSEITELKKKIVTTFPAKDASGQIVTFESEFEDAPLKSCIVQVNPVQDLHGYDSPWPAGGGKNLLDPGTGETIYGITKTVNEDGTITFTGTATGTVDFYFNGTTSDFVSVDFTAGDYFIMGSESGDATSFIFFWIYQKDGTTYYANGTDHNKVTLTGATPSRIFLRVYNEYSINLTLKLALMRGTYSASTVWSPYENICPISGWTGVGVQRAGKNLLSNIVNSTSTSSITFTVNEDRSITANGTATARANLFYSGALYIPPAEYYLSIGKTFAPGQCYFEIVLHKAATGSNVYINTNARSGCPFTVEKGDYIQRIYFSVFAGKTVNDTIYPQIELGSTATDYEPYTGQTYPITFPTEAGTMYCGTLDVTKGEFVVDRAVLTYNTANMSNDEIYPGWKDAKVTDIVGAGINTTMAKSVTNVGIGVGVNTIVVPGVIYLPRRLYNNLTQSDWKALALDIQIVLPLATPITYTLTPQEITSLLGTNNIWSNTGDTSVEYLMSDVSWYVEKKLRAFQSVLAGVEDSAVASKNYSTNSYLIFNDDIYRVTKTITAGETIEDGVNVTKTTVAEQLMALAQA